MKDSTGKGGIVPIVMVQQSDGKIIHSLLKKQQQLAKSQSNIDSDSDSKNKNKNSCTETMSIQATINAIKKSNDQNSCIICTDCYKVNDKIIQLPQCKHFFHENCILHWLESHNTCPFCRKELPLEDKKEEDERRRRATSSRGNGSGSGSGSGSGNGSTNGSSAVGTGGSRNIVNVGEAEQWESIFG